MTQESAAKDTSVYALRKKDLINGIMDEYPDVEHGLILLIGGFEKECLIFRQEPSFYYLTGIEEPAVMLTMELNGASTLYIPQYAQSRSKWVEGALAVNAAQAQSVGVSAIEYAGDQIAGYQCGPFFKQAVYKNCIERVRSVIHHGGTIFTLCPAESMSAYVEQRLVLSRLNEMVPGFADACVDISDIVAQLRRSKDMHEIELLYKAVGITEMAHDAVARSVAHGVPEADVQAGLEYVMTCAGAWPAFPSIVATGKNGTVLHYMANNGLLQKGELVVVDIGAAYAYYCADITRTYPVSGTFTPRQRELYTLVLETQKYIAEIARPGLWLSNKEKPKESLHHLAQEFLRERGYGDYFTHGIGHFLGLDVHDVGDYTRPLAEGDVITIEPGLYIPAESIGIRIEDNYWIVKGGAVCLSESIPKTIEEIEQWVQRSFADGVEPDEIVSMSFDDDLSDVMTDVDDDTEH
jgi:Xaa-Pro aminopeptidase